uniref:Uncharacterized protein n=1 Tax=Romanomermis culicivorax TaxID=13658 RepID=A0A915IAT4_ROMCU
MPSAIIVAQGPPLGIPKGSAMEVMDQIELVNLTDVLSVQDAMLAVWSVHMAKKCLHLLWALLKEPFQVEGPMAARVANDIKASLEGVRFAANHVITGQQHNLIQGLHAVLSGPVQLIFNTLIILAVDIRYPADLDSMGQMILGTNDTGTKKVLNEKSFSQMNTTRGSKDRVDLKNS